MNFVLTASVLPSLAAGKARWEDVAPYFDDLAERPLDLLDGRGGCAWSTLEELVTERPQSR
jgi:hypothetical protein